jgi:hypothetical protein
MSLDTICIRRSPSMCWLAPCCAHLGRLERPQHATCEVFTLVTRLFRRELSPRFYARDRTLIPTAARVISPRSVIAR